MRKCIDGIVYDLDKSIKIHNSYDETLYRTKKAKVFFLVRMVNDIRTITPISDREARDWLWNHSSEELERLFPGWEPAEA